MNLPTQIPSCFVVFILFTTPICEGTISMANAKFVQGKVVATSHRTIQPLSKIRCVEKCLEEGRNGMCRVAGYNKGTKACNLSVDSQNDVVDIADEMSGVFFMGNYIIRLIVNAYLHS